MRIGNQKQKNECEHRLLEIERFYSPPIDFPVSVKNVQVNFGEHIQGVTTILRECVLCGHWKQERIVGRTVTPGE